MSAHAMIKSTPTIINTMKSGRSYRCRSPDIPSPTAEGPRPGGDIETDRPGVRSPA